MSVAVLIGLGLLAGGASTSMILPASLSLIATLRALVDAAQDADPARFESSIAPINPFVGRTFKHHDRISALLKADLSAFGTRCQMLQREAKQLDRRSHLGLIPFGLYLAGLGLWSFLR